MTVYLVDGPDGVGKTGYATWLADEIGAVFLRLNPDDDFGELDAEIIERASATFNHTLMQLADQDVTIVVDRGPVSSIVYSRLFDRGKPGHAWLALDQIQPYIVYLRCDREELKIRYDDEKFSNVGQIAEEYDYVMSELEDQGHEVLTVDTSSGAPGEISDQIHRWNDSGKPVEVTHVDD